MEAFPDASEVRKSPQDLGASTPSSRVRAQTGPGGFVSDGFGVDREQSGLSNARERSATQGGTARVASESAIADAMATKRSSTNSLGVAVGSHHLLNHHLAQAQAPQLPPPTLDEIQHSLAKCIQRGSDLDSFLGCGSMIAAFGFAVVGVMTMTDDGKERTIAIQAVAFLIAQAFALSRAWRDWSLCKDRLGADTAKPSLLYVAMIAIFFVASVGFSVYSLASVVEWHGFYVVTLLWVSCSSLLASKAVRDRDFGKKFVQLTESAENTDGLIEILSFCVKSPVYQVVVWGSSAFAVGTTLVLMWSWDDETMELVMKGFFTLCVFFSQGSTFHLGKLMHDRADPIKSKELQEHYPFQFTVVLSSIVSYIVPLLIACYVDMETSKRFILLAGIGFMMSSSFFLVKHAKDHNELKELMAALVPHHQSELAGQSGSFHSQTHPGPVETVYGEGEDHPMTLPGQGLSQSTMVTQASPYTTPPASAKTPGKPKNVFGDDDADDMPLPPSGGPPMLAPPLAPRPQGQSPPPFGGPPNGQAPPLESLKAPPLAPAMRQGGLGQAPPLAPPALPGKQAPPLSPMQQTSGEQNQDEDPETRRIIEQLGNLRSNVKARDGQVGQALRATAEPESDNPQEQTGSPT